MASDSVTAGTLQAVSELGARTSDVTSVDLEVLALFDQTGPALVRYARAFGLQSSDAEDVVQEVFIALFRHLRLGRSRLNLRAWLFRVTHNLALKKRQRVVRLASRVMSTEDLGERADLGPTPDVECARRENHERLQRALTALPMKDQQCVVLRHEGLRYRQIARAVGISLGGVAKSLARSMARLAEVDEG
jgi:RNA polymerase sigma-70 factor (ECF subfamily)